MSSFEHLGLCPELCQATEEMGWLLPKDVQDESIPLILGGADVMIAAPTGSGKTGAFALPVLQLIHELLRGEAMTDGFEDENAGAEEGAAAEDQPVAWRLSENARDQTLQLDDTGRTAQSSHPKRWAGVRASAGVTQDCWYYEARVAGEPSGLCRLGWSTRQAGLNLGMDDQGWGFGGTGKRAWNRKFEDYGEAFGPGDVVGCYLDLERGRVFWSKNGKVFEQGALDIPKHMLPSGGGDNQAEHMVAFYPAVVLKESEMEFNFGDSPFAFPPADGRFQPLAVAPRRLTSLSSAAREAAAAAGPDAPRRFRGPLAVIIEPTKDLAMQVADEIEKFKAYLDFPQITHQLFVGGGGRQGGGGGGGGPAAFGGGDDRGEILDALKAGVHIAVGTLGRLTEFHRMRKLNLADCRFFVLDEADAMLENQDRKSIMSLFRSTPHEEVGVQVLICSATLHSDEIGSLSEAITHQPLWVDLKGKDSVPDTVDHAIIIADPRTDTAWQRPAPGTPQLLVPTDLVHVGGGGGNTRHASDPNPWASAGLEDPERLSQAAKLLKPQILLELLEQFKMHKCMIFCRTRQDCDNLAIFLTDAGRLKMKTPEDENPYSCVVLHAGINQVQRTNNLDSFRDGAVRFLISSDAGARGLDIKGLPFCINMCLPDKPELYVHRVGRVGRAGIPGMAFSIVSAVPERVWYHSNCPPKRRDRCQDRRSLAEGGCTLVYDEPALMQAIEQRLSGIKVPHLDRGNLAAGREAVIQMAMAGRAVDARALESEKHVEFLRPTAEHLYQLEQQVQASYFNLQNLDLGL